MGSRVIDGLKTNTNYSFYVRAKNVFGIWSDMPTTVSHTTSRDTSAPGSPSGFTVTTVPSLFLFNWNKNSEIDIRGGGYKLYVNTTNDSGNAKLLKEIGYTSEWAVVGIGDKTNDNTITIAADTTYYFWLSVVDASGNESGRVASSPTSASTTSAASAGETIPKSLIDAKGDLIVGQANDTPARLAVGTDGYILTADSAQTLGVRWSPHDKATHDALDIDADTVDDKHESDFVLLDGRSGGQTVYGGTAASEDLVLRSTSHTTKGDIILADDGGNVGIGTTGPINKLDVSGNLGVLGGNYLRLYDSVNSTWASVNFDGSSVNADYPWYFTNSEVSIVTAGNVGIGTSSLPSGGGTPVLAMAQASGNPTGIPSDTAGIFAKDVGGTCELFAFDEAGNVTQLSAHPQDLIDQIPDTVELPHFAVAENIYLGKRIGIDLVTLAREVEHLTGAKLIYEFDFTASNWDEDQAKLVAARNEAREAALQQLAKLEDQITSETDEAKVQQLIKEKDAIVVPEPYNPKPMPSWLARRLNRLASR